MTIHKCVEEKGLSPNIMENRPQHKEEHKARKFLHLSKEIPEIYTK